MLFALDSGAFITSLTPFRAVQFWARLPEDEDVKRLADLIGSRCSRSVEADENSKSLWRMTGRGSLVVKGKRFQVSPSLIQPPILRHSLSLELVPSNNGMSWPRTEHVAARIARLRRELAQLWQLRVEKQTIVGLPVYEVGLLSDVRALMTAWIRIRTDVDLEALILDNMLPIPNNQAMEMC